MRHRLVGQVIFAVDFRATFAASGKSPMRSPTPVCTDKSACVYQKSLCSNWTRVAISDNFAHDPPHARFPRGMNVKGRYRSCPANLSLLACFFISCLKLRSETISRSAICTASVRDLAPRTFAASSTSRTSSLMVITATDLISNVPDTH